MRTELEKLGDDLRVIHEQRTFLSTKDMAKDAMSAVARYFKRVYAIDITSENSWQQRVQKSIDLEDSQRGI